MPVAAPKPVRKPKERKRYMTTKSRKVATSEADKRHLLAVKWLPCSEWSVDH